MALPSFPCPWVAHGQTNKQKFKVRQPQRAARSKRPNTPLNDAIDDLANAGIVSIVAAGNNRGADACTMSPASASSSITVGASDSQDKIASFSNIGRCLSLFAPGVSIVGASHKSDTGEATMSGTSMAA